MAPRGPFRRRESARQWTYPYRGRRDAPGATATTLARGAPACARDTEYSPAGSRQAARAATAGLATIGAHPSGAARPGRSVARQVAVRLVVSRRRWLLPRPDY